MRELIKEDRVEVDRDERGHQSGRGRIWRILRFSSEKIKCNAFGRIKRF